MKTVKQDKTTDKLSLYEKQTLAQMFLAFWWVKSKAVEIGRLKSCRSSKLMKIDESLQKLTVSQLRTKLAGSITTQHCANIKHIVENHSFYKEAVVGRKIQDYALSRGYLRLRFTRDQHITNSMLPIIWRVSDLPIDMAQDHFLVNTRTPIHAYAVSQITLSKKAFLADYQEIEKYLIKVKNSIALVDRVAGQLPEEVKSSYQYYISRPNLPKIEFLGVSVQNFSVETVLSSAVRITNVRNARDYNVAGNSLNLPEVSRSRRRTTQEILNNYVDTVIVPRGE